METMTYCELCSRYGVQTPVTGEIIRELEGEGIAKVYEFAVCQCCADMLDSDTRTDAVDEA